MTSTATACENCATPLHGEYCHQCGQSVHNPIRDARHAVEEFFEAFWHLDGRLWRTLRDLMVPGRTASNYIAGHRARYIPPLRLFVVLSVLTFFIGALTIRVDMDVSTGGGDTMTRTILEAGTVEEVERERDRLLAEIEQARSEAANVPGVDPALLAAEIKIRGEAANRIAELRGAAGGQVDADGASPAGTEGSVAAAAPVPSKGELFSPEHEAWDPEKSPIVIDWLPDAGNAWLNERAAFARENVLRMDGRPDLWLKAFMAAVPSALFVLVPVFALLLKVAYLLKRRLYLEHLVVALYSHVFLLLALTAAFLLSALAGALTPVAGWLEALCSLLVSLVLMWMPVYLLLMQKRVYGQGWPMTLLKYLVIGFVYMNLLALVTAVMFVLRLSQG